MEGRLALQDRLTPEVYYDILCAIHLIGRAGKRVTLYHIGHRAAVPNNRLKDRLNELRAIGLIDSNLHVTQKGYDFCGEYSKQVSPFLRKYGLSHGE